MAVRVGRDKESLWRSMMTGRRLARSWRGVRERGAEEKPGAASRLTPSPNAGPRWLDSGGSRYHHTTTTPPQRVIS